MESKAVLLHKDVVNDRFSYVTCINTKSQNTKTGDMAQVGILCLSKRPTDAVHDGSDIANCGDCPLRGSQVCYVNPVSYNNSWLKHHKNSAEKCPEYDKAVRFGFYGDSAYLPIRLIKQILSAQKGEKKRWAGYTHQWHKASKLYARYFMASIDKLMANQLGYKNIIECKNSANSKGYRTFRVLEPKDKLVKGEIMCPYEKTGINCNTCLLCSGIEGRGKKNIAILIHGPNNKVVTYRNGLDK